MADTHAPHAVDEHASEDVHGHDDHGDDHGHEDHAHAGMAVGPIDVQAWSMATLGVVLGLAVVVALMQATS